MMIKGTTADKIKKSTVKEVCQTLDNLAKNYDLTDEEWNDIHKGIDSWFNARTILHK